MSLGPLGRGLRAVSRLGSRINPHKPSHGGTVAPPTLSSAVIPSAGTSISLTFSASVSIGAGGNGGASISMSGGASTLTYASGSGSTVLVYSLSRTVESGETGTVSYTQPGNGIEATSGGADVSAFSAQSLTNNSTYTAGGGAFPNSANTGPENRAGYTSLSDNGTTSVSTSQTFNFQRFGGMTVTAGTVVFNGCEFVSNWVDGWNVLINGAGANVTFNDCRFRPPLNISIPNAAWPCAGFNVAGVQGPGNVAYQIGGNDGYQYGCRITNCSAVTFNRCDVWGFGNSIDMPGGSNVTIDDCWIHDAAYESPQNYHTDGPGYLDGGGAPNNVKVRRCTIATLGNTNGIAFQAATSGYNGMIVDGCYLTGFGITVDMCHGTSFATNCKFINNKVSSGCMPVYGLLYGGESTVFAVGKTTNEWRNNTVEILRNGVGYTTADNGKYLLPSGNVSATDYVDGFP